MRLSNAPLSNRAAGAILVALAALAGCSAQDYTNIGPYELASIAGPVVLAVPATGQDPAENVTVDAVVTYPASASGSAPVLVMFNGFQCQAPWYAGVVRHVASWGYVLGQYTLRAGVSDRRELDYLAPFLDWLLALPPVAAAAGPALRLGVVGHSRGGKLAALHYAALPRLATAVLLDPVDGTPWAPIGPDRPSAVAALAAAKAAGLERPAALLGAGVVRLLPGLSPDRTACNPPAHNASKFWPVLGDGSWGLVVKQAGHMQFASSPDWSYRAINAYCDHGPVTEAAVIEEAATVAVAWLESVFRPQQTLPPIPPPVTTVSAVPGRTGELRQVARWPRSRGHPSAF